MSALYHEYLVEDRDFKDYDDLQAHCRLKAPKDFNFAYDIVDRYATDFPGKRALVWLDDNGEEHEFTFDDISRESKRAAYWLSSKGIKKGDTVMLMVRRRYEWWFLMPALHRIGAIAIPATDQLLQTDIEYRIKAADVKLIICYDNPHSQEQIEKAVANTGIVQKLVTVGKTKREGWDSFHEEYEKMPAEFPRPVGEAATHNEDPMLLYFTSGTSGYPKMVIQDYLYPIGHIMTAKYWHGVVEDGLHLTIAETGWAKASWGKIYGQWICGTAQFVYDMNMLKPDKMLTLISKYGLTTFCAPPTVYRFLVRQDLSKYDLSKCTRFSTAGEALNGEVYNKWLEQTGKKIYEGYGQSESTVICGNFLETPVKPGSMGRPNPLYDVEVLDPNGDPVAPGEVGELCIHVEHGRPYGLLMGYYKDVSLTAAAFDGGVYHTGDNVYEDEDGYVWFVGRKDDIIKSSGYRISPFEVESVLQKHPAVLECAVTGVEDPKRGMAVKATIVLSSGYENKDPKEMETEISTFAKENTAMYKCPRIYEFVKELPKTVSGKIRRVEIREKDKGRDTNKIKQEF
ncbi:MAG: AMP-binding protein [Treponema sp.]|nr:AMP-binding protein [Treponema sp.]